jgi:hypothetical protein
MNRRKPAHRRNVRAFAMWAVAVGSFHCILPTATGNCQLFGWFVVKWKDFSIFAGNKGYENSKRIFSPVA